MREAAAKKYMSIPMAERLYSRANCKVIAEQIASEEKITGMSLSQLACEIFAHAYIYYNFKFVPKFLRGAKIFKSIYNSVENGVDLEDNGDKWYRRIAYRMIWLFPAF